VYLGEVVRRRHEAGALVVQPRMGFADPARMRAGLLATRAANASTVGTITLDSFTRVGDLASAERALRDGIELNGYPIVTHDEATTRAVLAGVRSADFPVQVRHGSARPNDICKALLTAGLHDTEGGPVSYCLPYGRTSLAESVCNWRDSCVLLADSAARPHVEVFGGCMMGQLCPPSQLVAISVLEALFVHSHGIHSVSMSYAQQTNGQQDREAVDALRRLGTLLLPGAEWHIVIYTYMGLYPRTPIGALELLASSAELATSTGAERLVVKTVAEAHRIPAVGENVAALEHAAAVAAAVTPRAAAADGGQVYREAYALVDAVLNLDADIGRALLEAFQRGLLDVPYCVHPDNAGRTRGHIDAGGRLVWADIGGLPLRGVVEHRDPRRVTSATLLQALSFVQRTFDARAVTGRAGPVGGELR
jgi:methylaspartate mutase epsilon subunit